jgi:hypothetical protein
MSATVACPRAAAGGCLVRADDEVTSGRIPYIARDEDSISERVAAENACSNELASY